MAKVTIVIEDVEGVTASGKPRTVTAMSHWDPPCPPLYSDIVSAAQQVGVLGVAHINQLLRNGGLDAQLRIETEKVVVQ